MAPRIKQIIKYRIEFIYLSTNYTSHGPWHESRELLDYLVNDLNKEYAGKMNHWISESTSELN